MYVCMHFFMIGVNINLNLIVCIEMLIYLLFIPCTQIGFTRIRFARFKKSTILIPRKRADQTDRHQDVDYTLACDTYDKFADVLLRMQHHRVSTISVTIQFSVAYCFYDFRVLLLESHWKFTFTSYFYFKT